MGIKLYKQRPPVDWAAPLLEQALGAARSWRACDERIDRRPLVIDAAQQKLTFLTKPARTRGWPYQKWAAGYWAKTFYVVSQRLRRASLGRRAQTVVPRTCVPQAHRPYQH